MPPAVVALKTGVIIIRVSGPRINEQKISLSPHVRLVRAPTNVGQIGPAGAITPLGYPHLSETLASGKDR